MVKIVPRVRAPNPFPSHLPLMTKTCDISSWQDWCLQHLLCDFLCSHPSPSSHLVDLVFFYLSVYWGRLTQALNMSISLNFTMFFAFVERGIIGQPTPLFRNWVFYRPCVPASTEQVASTKGIKSVSENNDRFKSYEFLKTPQFWGNSTLIADLGYPVS